MTESNLKNDSSHNDSRILWDRIRPSQLIPTWIKNPIIINGEDDPTDITIDSEVERITIDTNGNETVSDEPEPF